MLPIYLNNTLIPNIDTNEFCICIFKISFSYLSVNYSTECEYGRHSGRNLYEKKRISKKYIWVVLLKKLGLQGLFKNISILNIMVVGMAKIIELV